MKLCRIVILTIFISISFGSMGEGKSKPDIIDKSSSGYEGDFGFGSGLSFTFDLGNHDRIKSAEVVDGVVRVSDEENGIPRLVLEGHYFFRDSIFGTNQTG